MPIVATQRVPYGKKRYEVGEEIPASPKDAKLLVAIGKAREADQASVTDLPKRAAPEAVSAPEAVEETAVEPVAEVETKEAEPEAPVRPQTYATRHMEAGQTGEAKPSRSSRPARRQKGKH